jgi:GMP synthase (glutamine-hydrolysing)
MINEIKADVGNSEAIIGLSGGIDSSVATAIAARAINARLTAVFVDHGFMREDEPEEVRNAFKNFKINFVTANAQERFMKTEGATDPRRNERL